MSDFRQLCLRMADELDHYRQLLTDDRCAVHLLAAEARAALATPTPPADGEAEAEKLAQWLEKTYEYANELGRPDWAQFSRRAAALLREARPQPGWQPISTAPTDGTEILASDYDTIEIVMSRDCSPPTWRERGGARIYPAWWQPLPKHPPIPTEPTTAENTNGAN